MRITCTKSSRVRNSRIRSRRFCCTDITDSSISSRISCCCSSTSSSRNNIIGRLT